MLANSQAVPQLNTNFSEPLKFLERHFLTHCKKIEDWFQKQWHDFPPPVYGSVDLRNAGFKLAPIDMNLFPAGFNNLNPNYLSTSVKGAKKIIHQFMPEAKRILLIPETHTRNLFYWENIKTIQKILENAGFEMQLGSLSHIAHNVKLNSGEEFIVEPISRNNNKLHIKDFTPDLILLNNDLSEGIPEILQNLDHLLIPPAKLGWSHRLKSDHFQYYAEVTQEFSDYINIDPWLISPLFKHCGKIDFMEQEGMECLVSNAEILFAAILKKYQEYKIPQQPFLVVKADAGTYGMAVMTVRNVEELKTLNRKQRTRMASTKGGQPVHRVIIQEGVYTFETLGPENAVAEPVVYLWGDCVVGGFYRVHKERGVDENLNTPGMHFEPLAFSHACDEPCQDEERHPTQNRFYLYGVVAQLSMLAAAREIKECS